VGLAEHGLWPFSARLYSGSVPCRSSFWYSKSARPFTASRVLGLSVPSFASNPYSAHLKYSSNPGSSLLLYNR